MPPLTRGIFRCFRIGGTLPDDRNDLVSLFCYDGDGGEKHLYGKLVATTIKDRVRPSLESHFGHDLTPGRGLPTILTVLTPFSTPPVPVLAAFKQLLAWSGVSVSRDAGLRGRAQTQVKQAGKLSWLILLVLFAGAITFAFAPMWMSFMSWGAEEQSYLLNLIVYQIPAGVGILVLLAGISFHAWLVFKLVALFEPTYQPPTGDNLARGAKAFWLCLVQPGAASAQAWWRSQVELKENLARVSAAASRSLALHHPPAQLSRHKTPLALFQRAVLRIL